MNVDSLIPCRQCYCVRCVLVPIKLDSEHLLEVAKVACFSHTRAHVSKRPASHKSERRPDLWCHTRNHLLVSTNVKVHLSFLRRCYRRLDENSTMQSRVYLKITMQLLLLPNQEVESMLQSFRRVGTGRNEDFVTFASIALHELPCRAFKSMKPHTKRITPAMIPGSSLRRCERS